MRPPGVVPASSVPSWRTASAVTQAASSVGDLARALLVAGVRRLGVDREDLPLVAGAEVRGLPVARLAPSTTRTRRRAARGVVFMPGTTSPVGKIMLPVASPSSKSLAVV